MACCGFRQKNQPDIQFASPSGSRRKPHNLRKQVENAAVWPVFIELSDFPRRAASWQPRERNRVFLAMRKVG
jgi:hypothetical protein